MTTLTDDFAYEVLSVVAEIPEGRVATYGQIARLVGKEKNARLVAKILSRAEYYGHFPCHRVVNREGRLAHAFAFGGPSAQADLLEREGVPCLLRDGDYYVDLKRFAWRVEIEK